jgi:hypothetical protein
MIMVWTSGAPNFTYCDSTERYRSAGVYVCGSNGTGSSPICAPIVVFALRAFIVSWTAYDPVGSGRYLLFCDVGVWQPG